MSWTNYHSHSNFCDGKYSPAVYIPEALKRDFAAYGFSSHAPLPFVCDWCMSQEQLPEYIQAINTLKQEWAEKIQIYCGLEIDYIPGILSPASFMKQHGLDYCIGSVHFVEKSATGMRWEVDGPHNLFLEGLQAIFKNDIRRAVERYYEVIRQMITEETPTIVGHLDKIKIQNQLTPLFDESEDWYQEAVSDTLQAIARKEGLILEVNTRGLYKKKAVETYPSRWVLEQAFLLNIPITLQSDSHHPQEIDGYFKETALVLYDIGYRHLHICWNGRWQPMPLLPAGTLAIF